MQIQGGSLPPDFKRLLRTVVTESEPGVPSPQDRLGPVGDLELGEDRGQVIGDGLR